MGLSINSKAVGINQAYHQFHCFWTCIYFVGRFCLMRCLVWKSHHTIFKKHYMLAFNGHWRNHISLSLSCARMVQTVVQLIQGCNLLCVLNVFLITILTVFQCIVLMDFFSDYYRLKIFVPITILAFAVLVPVNWTNDTLESMKVVHSSIDKLSISNIPNGSKRWTIF
jgi:hypothetical protein